jgi:hypothetical protein
VTDVEQAAQEAVARAKAMSESVVEKANHAGNDFVKAAVADVEKMLSKQTIVDVGEKATAEVATHPKGSLIAAVVLAGFFAIAAFGQHYALKKATAQTVTLSHQIEDANADRHAIWLQLGEATKRAQVAESARTAAEARVCKPKIITRTVKVTVPAPAKAPVRHTFRLPLVQSGQ